MKSIFMSGVSARVKRWYNLLFVTTVMGMLVITTGSSASADVYAPHPMVACIPMNDNFVGPLRPLVKEIIGAVGGLIPIFVSVLIIVSIVIGLYKVFKNQDLSDIVKTLVAIPSVFLIGVGVLILVNSIITVINNLCTSNPF